MRPTHAIDPVRMKVGRLTEPVSHLKRAGVCRFRFGLNVVGANAG